MLRKSRVCVCARNTVSTNHPVQPTPIVDVGVICYGNGVESVISLPSNRLAMTHSATPTFSPERFVSDIDLLEANSLRRVPRLTTHSC
jgi:hypothetical protein